MIRSTLEGFCMLKYFKQRGNSSSLAASQNKFWTLLEITILLLLQEVFIAVDSITGCYPEHFRPKPLPCPLRFR